MYAASYIWAKVLCDMEQHLGEIMVSAWLDDAEVVKYNDSELVIYSPSEFRQEQIRASCAPYIEDTLKRLFRIDAKLVVWGETEMKANTDRNKQDHSFFNSQFVFDNFVAGTTNVAPLKIASAVANAPGFEIYNPVFFYGPPGVGKTHLLYSIANGIAKQHPDKKIVCVKGDQFTNELVRAIQEANTAEFRGKYRAADVLLVDDIQFIAGKEATQEEFFHTFNELYDSGRQIVMTADRKPANMATLEDRLRSRFGVGVMVAMNQPDYETRRLITTAKATRLGIALDEDIIRFIAKNLSENTRQIEGALKKLRAFRDLAGMELTLENVAHTIQDMSSAENSVLITPELILRNVCKYYGVDELTLKGTRRSRNISEPRQVAIYLMRQILNMNQDEIAKIFCRDRTTINYVLKQVSRTIQIKGNKLDPILQDLHDTINACI